MECFCSRRRGLLEHFHRTLRESTPHVWVTSTLLVINVLVYAVMVFSGVHPISPTTEDLAAWGAGFSPLTLSGEWWRLATPMFLHIGFFHLLVNALILRAMGPLVERLVGNFGFLVLYLVSGLCGSLASHYWHPLGVSAGASGAIFGVFGAMIALLLLAKEAFTPELHRKLIRGGVAFLLVNVAIGAMEPRIDLAAHLGGLAAGFVWGLILAGQPGKQTAVRRIVRPIAVALLGFAAVSTGMLLLPYSDANAYVKARNDFVTTEKQTIDRYNAARDDVMDNRLTEEQFADVIERNVLPPWREIRQRLQDAKEVPFEAKEEHALLLDYLKVRQDAWELSVLAIRNRDPEIQNRADAAYDESARPVEKLKKLGP